MFHGQKAGAEPSSQPRPHQTGTPRAAASSASVRARRVLPIPGSPASSTTRPLPPSALVERGVQLGELALAIDQGDGSRVHEMRGVLRPVPLNYSLQIF